MFKKPVEEHQAELAKRLFPSSSPTSPPPSGRPAPKQQSLAAYPLSTASGNKLGTNGSSTTKAFGPPKPPASASHGLKRTSSGLTKIIQSGDPFKEPSYPRFGAQVHGDVNKENAQSKPPVQPMQDMVYIAEDDFDDEIDLDVEDPTGKGSISYPIIPSQAAGSHVHQRPSTASSIDSGYKSHSSRAVSTFEPPSNLSQMSQFAYAKTGLQQSKDSSSNGDAARPAKRRTLPWLSEQADKAKMAKPGQKSNSIRNSFTPLPKDKKGSLYPWNTTASAMKEQQKNFKQANKSLVKAGEGTDQSRQDAANIRKRQTVTKVLLSLEQKHILDLVVDKQKSVFFTGSAGTGKSVLLRQIVQELRKKFIREPDRLAVTASTGLAACNIGGVTLHSFAGIGLGKDTVEEHVKKIKRNAKHKHRWLRTKVLIVDEISMIDGDLFDKLEQIARRVRNNGRPFGGIQLVITGDFFQLPPVPEKNKAAKFAFDADTWNTTVEHTIGLHHVFRQKDPVFAGMLNEMREGRLSQQSINVFKSLDRELDFTNGIDATELFPRRNEVDQANNSRMRQLVGETMTFEARDGGSINDKEMRDRLLSNCMAPENVTLKKGAQVMLIKNMDETLVNGSLGRVIGFMNEATWDTYQTNEDVFHRTQADTEDETEEVNLSRAERISKSKLQELANNGAPCWPVVRFSISDGTTRDMLCHRETWKVELPNGEVQASRAQIPLILAWALSIHKAQGQTLERVKINLRNVFENGQAYVALSRATSMEGLQVIGFDPKKVFAHDKVREFYRNLSRVETRQEGVARGNREIRSGSFSAGNYEAKFGDQGFEDAEDAMRAYG